MSQAKRTIEEVYQMTVLNGTAGNSMRITPPTGKVKRIVIDYDQQVAIPNPGYMQTYINDSNGIEIVKTQGIRLLRSREVAYEHDGKLVNLDTNGRSFIWAVQSQSGANNTADFPMTLTLVYDVEDESCAIQ